MKLSSNSTSTVQFILDKTNIWSVRTNLFTIKVRFIDGIGNSQTYSLKKFFLDNQNLKIVSKLTNILNVIDYKILNKKTPISGKLIMFTGGFVDKSRSELKSLAERSGAKIVSNISKKTDFLVAGSQKPTTKKINDAKNLKIKILTEDEWNKIINQNRI